MRHGFSSLILCLAGCTLLCGGTVEAKTYYLSTTGSDANDGTTKPWKTFVFAMTKLLPGDTLEAAAGSYAEQVVLSQTALAASPITVRAAAGAKVTIAGGGILPANTDEGLLHVSGSYIVVDGLEVTGSKYIGVYISGAGNRITGCKIHDNQQFGIHAYQAKAAEVTKNELFQNVLANKTHAAAQHDNGLELYLAESAKVTDNKVYKNHGEGIVISRGQGNLVRGNWVYDNLSDEIFVNNTVDAVVDGNFIYCTAGSGFEVGGERPNGAVIGDSDYGTGTTTSGTRLVNNIVVGCNVNFLWFATTVAGTGLRNALVAHNTLVQAANTGMQIDKGAHQSSTIANNIVVQSNGSMINISGTLTGLTFSHNNWLGGSAGNASRPTDIVGNCNLADISKLDPSGFKIAAGSPCQDKGQALTQVATDFFGTARPIGPGYDVGAHEVSAGPSGDRGAGETKSVTDGRRSDGRAAGDGAGSGDGAAAGDGARKDGKGCGCALAERPAPSSAPFWISIVLALAAALLKRRA